jgi:hypothetical protein
MANLDGEACQDKDVEYVFLDTISFALPDSEARTCLGTFVLTNPYWTNVTVDNWIRSWTWMVYVFSFASISILTILLGATKLVSTKLGLLKANLRS